MEQQPSGSNLELLRYANAVRTRSRRDLGIAAIAAVFITFTIIDAATPAPLHLGQARNATSPPSIGSTTPVTQRDSSEAR